MDTFTLTPPKEMNGERDAPFVVVQNHVDAEGVNPASAAVGTCASGFTFPSPALLDYVERAAGQSPLPVSLGVANLSQAEFTKRLAELEDLVKERTRSDEVKLAHDAASKKHFGSNPKNYTGPRNADGSVDETTLALREASSSGASGPAKFAANGARQEPLNDSAPFSPESQGFPSGGPAKSRSRPPRQQRQQPGPKKTAAPSKGKSGAKGSAPIQNGVEPAGRANGSVGATAAGSKLKDAPHVTVASESELEPPSPDQPELTPEEAFLQELAFKRFKKTSSYSESLSADGGMSGLWSWTAPIERSWFIRMWPAMVFLVWILLQTTMSIWSSYRDVNFPIFGEWSEAYAARKAADFKRERETCFLGQTLEDGSICLGLFYHTRLYALLTALANISVPSALAIVPLILAAIQASAAHAIQTLILTVTHRLYAPLSSAMAYVHARYVRIRGVLLMLMAPLVFYMCIIAAVMIYNSYRTPQNTGQEEYQRLIEVTLGQMTRVMKVHEIKIFLFATSALKFIYASIPFVLVAATLWAFYLLTPLSWEVLYVDFHLNRFAVPNHDVRNPTERMRDTAFNPHNGTILMMEGTMIFVLFRGMFADWRRKIELPSALLMEALGPKFDQPNLKDEDAYARLFDIGRLGVTYNLNRFDLDNDWQRKVITVAWKIIRMRRREAAIHKEDFRMAGDHFYALRTEDSSMATAVMKFLWQSLKWSTLGLTLSTTTILCYLLAGYLLPWIPALHLERLFLLFRT